MLGEREGRGRTGSPLVSVFRRPWASRPLRGGVVGVLRCPSCRPSDSSAALGVVGNGGARVSVGDADADVADAGAAAAEDAERPLQVFKGKCALPQVGTSRS